MTRLKRVGVSLGVSLGLAQPAGALGQRGPAPEATAPVPAGARGATTGVPPLPSRRSQPRPALPPTAARPVPAETRVATGEEAYQIQLRGLEEKVNELKEKIFRAKARLVRLQETVLSGRVSGAYAVIYHHNDMGSSFELEQASYFLDGSPIYQPTSPSELSRKRIFPIFQGAVVPGNHTISVSLAYRGSSSVFPYWRGYRFKIRSSHTFHFEEGKVSSIKVVGFEKGGITTQLQDRPSIRFDVDVKKMNRKTAANLPGVEVP